MYIYSLHFIFLLVDGTWKCGIKFPTTGESCCQYGRGRDACGKPFSRRCKHLTIGAKYLMSLMCICQYTSLLPYGVNMCWREESMTWQITAIISRNRNIMAGIGKISWKDKPILYMKDNHLKALGYMDSIVTHRTYFHGCSFWTVESALHLLWSNPWKALENSRCLQRVVSPIFRFVQDNDNPSFI